MIEPWYATREEVARELDFKEPARSAPRIDRVIAAVSRDIEGMCHRRFYPQAATRYWDWPTGARPWRLWLDDSEVISVTALSSGGVTIAPADFLLEPNRNGPPYNRIEIDLDGPAAFGGGGTHQRDVTVVGLFGYRDDESPGGEVDGTVSSSATTMHVTDSAAVGVGSVLRVGTERLIVTGKSMRDTGQNLAAPVDARQKTVTIPVADGTTYTVGEIILLDAERMLIEDIAGNSLVVSRAVDGTVLAAHTGSTIYALRTLTVVRGALSTTATALVGGEAVHVWQPPAPVRDLCVAESAARLMQGRSGWARVVGTGEAQREASGRGLKDLRDQVYRSHGRKGRVRSV